MRANNGIYTIDVNDQGESITVNLNDAALITDYLSLVGEIEEANRSVAELTADLTGTPAERIQKVRKAAEFNLEVCKKLKVRVDKVFRDDVCRKLFGDIVPAIPSLMDFVAQFDALLHEFGEKQAAEAQARIAKHTAKYEQRNE